jgi:hypothetical protein
VDAGRGQTCAITLRRLPIADSASGASKLRTNISAVDAGTNAERKAVKKKLTVSVLAVNDARRLLTQADEHSDTINVYKNAGESTAFFDED